jgi:phosphopantetheinyl transferase
MPITKIEKVAGRAWGLWKIEEEEYELNSLVSDYETIPERIRHPGKRLEFIAGRVLVRNLMEDLGLPFRGLTKDEFGKPYLKESTHQVSLTHSFPYVAAIIDSGKAAGIDLEQIKPKLVNIGPRVLHVSELRDAGQDETKHCVYWCCKETLMKIY